MQAAKLARSGTLTRGQRSPFRRDHVNEIVTITSVLLAEPHSPEDVVALLDAKLITCSVLNEEDNLLGRGDGWQRYRVAKIAVQRGIDADAPRLDLSDSDNMSP